MIPYEPKYTNRAKARCRKGSEAALLKGESLSRALRCLHEAEQTLAASKQLLDTLEKRHAVGKGATNWQGSWYGHSFDGLIEVESSGEGRTRIKKLAGRSFPVASSDA